jgi:hypothetical protein
MLDHATSAVTDHLSCIGCGYDLYGRHEIERCPECGLPVSDSCAKWRLIFADRRLLRSTKLVLWLVILHSLIAFVIEQFPYEVANLVPEQVLLAGYRFLIAMNSAIPAYFFAAIVLYDKITWLRALSGMLVFLCLDRLLSVLSLGSLSIVYSLAGAYGTRAQAVAEQACDLVLYFALLTLMAHLHSRIPQRRGIVLFGAAAIGVIMASVLPSLGVPAAMIQSGQIGPQVLLGSIVLVVAACANGLHALTNIGENEILHVRPK